MNLHHFRQLHSNLVSALERKAGIEFSQWDDEDRMHVVEIIGFNMAYWISSEGHDVIDHVDNCGTVACLGGWCAITMGQHPRDLDRGGPLYYGIHGYLGIDDRQGQILFRPRSDIPWSQITAETAIKALEIIIETDDIPYDLWDKAIRATTPVSNAIDYEPA